MNTGPPAATLASRPAGPATRSATAGKRSILHYCHHSTGIGHLVRSAAIAAALAERNRVVFCAGGQVPDGFEFAGRVEPVRLPPIGTGPGGGLISLDPAISLERAMAERARSLQFIFEDLRPDLVMIELFPYGRRKFAPELLPLLELCRTAVPRPVVVCSVRDLLVTGHPRQQQYDDEAAARLDAYFDAVIVHGDPAFARLEETFRPRLRPSVPVSYSGFVAPAGRPAAGPRHRSVVVSAGGGLVGRELFTAAVAAHRSGLAAAGLTTRIITGPLLPEADFRSLAGQAETTPGLTVERFTSDLCAVLAASLVSVSQCGYNTSLDLIRSGVPAVVVPYGEGAESEQRTRAARLARLGLVRVLPPAELSASSLAAAVLALASPAARTAGTAARSPGLMLDGAARTAELVGSLLMAAPGGSR